MKNLKKFYISKFFLALIAFTFLIIQQNALADRKSGPERVAECNTDGTLKNFLVAYPPGEIFKDMEFDLSNPTCQGIALQEYISLKALITSIDVACNKNTSPPSPFPTPIKDFMILSKALLKISDKSCNVVYSSFAPKFAVSMAIFGTIYGIAFDTYKNVRVCGHDWYGLDNENYTNDKIGNYQEIVNKEKDNGSYSDNKYYRENFHKGKEFSDRVVGEETCIDPKTKEAQKYYFRGLQQADYLCEKYNPVFNDSNMIQEYKKAYNCCLNRRQNYICLEKETPMRDHIFCRAGQKCSFPTNRTISFEAYKRENNRLICAKSYSLCPFNFSIAGGTVYPDFFKDGIMNPDGKYMPFKRPENADGATMSNCNEKSEIKNTDCSLNQKKVGKIKNYCQYYTHCTVVSPISYKPDFKNLSPYFSKACLDSVGDSQNTQSNKSISYDPGLGLGNQNTFSAPIVQCVKETMENIFKNIAGHSKCVDGTYGNRNNICENESYRDIPPTGSLKWKKGNKVKEVSLFEILQSRLKNIITIFLVLSVTFLGAKILILKVDISNKKEILTYLLKIGLVIYFVNGNAWKDIFFDGIYRGSSEISRIFFKINAVEDGKFKNLNTDKTGYKCNFGSLFNESGEKVDTTRSYPAGKDYLMVWDTLDCKIMQYLNYGPTFDSGTIFALIIASFFTGGIGLILAFAIFILAFSLIATVIRAMHIFISSAIAIIIYVFVSPIIIPLILFEKTKGIFDAWLTQLISFTLQPIILFSFLAIFITLSEKILYKDAIFDNRNLVCQEHCRDVNDKIITDLNICKSSTSGSTKYSDIINPTELTPACILRINDFKKNNGFAMLGIYLPEVFKLNNNKILLILKSALFLYVLLQMVDQIPGITSSLTGEIIDVKSVGGIEMLKKFTAGVRAIQKRAARSIQNQIPDPKKDDNKEGDEKEKATDSAQGGDQEKPAVDSAGENKS